MGIPALGSMTVYMAVAKVFVARTAVACKGDDVTMAGRRLAGGAAGGSFLSRSVFFLRRGEGDVIQAEPRLTAESEMS